MLANNKFFKVEYSYILKNYFYIMILVVVLGFTSKLALRINILADSFVFGLCILYFICFKRLSSILFLDKEGQACFNFSQFFIKSTETIGMSKLFFAYKSEISGRGSKSMVLSFYNDKNQLIIKLIPVSSGWSDVQIMNIVDTCRDFKINELKDEI